jgi:subtilisin family serine protease
MPHRMRSLRFARVLATLLAAAAVLPGAALAASERPLPADPTAAPTTPAAPRHAPDRLIVVWEPGTSGAERAATRAQADTALVRTLGASRFQLVAPEAGQSPAGALAELRGDPSVRSATRDTFSVLHATTNDPLFGHLWGLENFAFGVAGFGGAVADADIDVERAWDRTRGTPATVVADLDTGYRFGHPDLAAVAWDNPADPPNGVDDDGNGIVDDSHGADFVGPSANSVAVDGDPTDDDLVDGGHGVHTAGTIGAAGNDGAGISGVAQDVRIMPLRVCGFYTDPDPAAPDESGTVCPSSSQIAAINYAGGHGARAANMSLGGTTFNAAVRDAFAANPGTLFVISAGNDAEDNELVPHYPCGYDPSTSGIPGAIDNIVCVAATDQADQLADFSDWGARSVDLAAPGTEILSTWPWMQHVFETFEVDDFAASWSATGANGGFARTSEAPLASFGMSDSPGAAPVALSIRESTSTGVTIPAGYRRCTLEQTRVVSLGVGGTYTYTVLLNGTPLAASSPSGSGSFALDVTSPGLAAGGRLQLRFRYTAGATPSSANGVWLDDIVFTCSEPVGQTTGYGFLDGTSMAAPHVTGAAALLFSLKPSATVAEAKGALLGTADPLPSLAGRTVTGGRLNAADALEALAPASVAPPPPPVVVAQPPAATVVKCKVPRLKGKSLRRAKRALRRAHCRLGTVTKPRRPRGGRLPPLVVRSSTPRAGAVRAAGARVRLTLRPKPRLRRR